MFQDLQKILQTTCARPYVHFAGFLSEEETLTGVVFDPIPTDPDASASSGAVAT